MKQLEFTASGEPLIGGSVEVQATVTTDGPPPAAVPVIVNDHPMQLSVTDGVASIRLEFLTPGITIVTPGEDYNGEALVLRAERRA